MRAMTRRMKRWMDVGAAVFGLIVLSPILAAAALAIRWRMGPPVLFKQVRPGLRGRPFVLVKFRTMRPEFDESGVPAPLGERVPPLGAFLRRTSIDELPQLWNILRGDMSLVGPRPLALEYLPRYSAEQARRHDVLPGLTGWAQVNGRHMLSWEERFALDVWYVDHWSLALDLRILFRTIGLVFSGGDQALPPSADFGFAPTADAQGARDSGSLPPGRSVH
jgi:lipopolysaccharide/colanic/teichoic acid biosynthesis glycosyltransferase